jgi:hypothetical protein
MEWTKEEEEHLEQHYHDQSAGDIADELGRSKPSVYGKADSMGLSEDRPHYGWGEGEEQFIRDNIGGMNTEELAEELGRTYSSVHNKIAKMDVCFPVMSMGMPLQDAIEEWEVELTDAEAGYIAGLIDGEGTVTIGRWSQGDGNYRYAPNVIILHSVEEEFVQDVRGMLDSARIKTTKGAKEPHSDRKRDLYRLDLTSMPMMHAVLKRVRPYLTLKRKQADVLMEFVEHRATHNRGDGYCGVEHDLCRRIRGFNKPMCKNEANPIPEGE